MTDLADFGAVDAAAAMARGEFSALDLAEALLARASAASALNAFITLDPETTRAAAAASDRRRASGAALGPLEGVPITFKDNIETAEFPTTAGSLALREHRPPRDAEIVGRFKRAGALVFGKTGMHEFAFGVTSNNGSFGAIRNPYAPTRSPGGSSGGTGVAVAARLATAGIGTDTGGSIRIPSSFCGLYGFRPTLGRWPGSGISPISRSRDTPGPLARSMRDIVALDAVVTGEAAPTAVGDLRGKRFGLPRRHFWEELDPQVEAMAVAAVLRLKDAGAHIVDVEIESLGELLPSIAMPIVLYEARLQLTDYLAGAGGTGLSLREAVDLIGSPDVRAIFEALAAEPPHVSRADYEAALNNALPALRNAYARAFAGSALDAFVYPVCPVPAPAIGDDETLPFKGRRAPTFPTLIRNTDPASAAGLAALSLPMGLDAGGVPVGLAFDQAPGRDRDLLALGLALEDLFPPPPAPRPPG